MNLSPMQNASIGHVLIVIGLCIAISTLIGLQLIDVGDFKLPFAFISITAGMWIVSIGRKLRIRHFEELLKDDARKPILYLRSFEDDKTDLQSFLQHFGITESREEALARIFYRLGPTIAIGKPGENLPPLGAYRKYVVNSEWQDVVTGLMKEAQFVIIRMADTPGLLWEFDNSVKFVDPSHIILYFPQSIWGGKIWKEKYNAFVEKISAQIPNIRFPSAFTVRFAELWTFDERWNFIELPSRFNLWWAIRGWARGSDIGVIYPSISVLFDRLRIPRPTIPISTLEWIAIPTIVVTLALVMITVVSVLISLVRTIFS